MKNTRKALIASAMSALLCLFLLISITFAWFNVDIGSGHNEIHAGNLEVSFEYSTDMENWSPVESKTDIFGCDSWQPGTTKEVYLKITNEGSIDLKYDLSLAISGEVTGKNYADEIVRLSDYIIYDCIADDDLLNLENPKSNDENLPNQENPDPKNIALASINAVLNTEFSGSEGENEYYNNLSLLKKAELTGHLLSEIATESETETELTEPLFSAMKTKETETKTEKDSTESNPVYSGEKIILSGNLFASKTDQNSKTVALILFMPLDVGDEANYKSDDVQPKIPLSIKLVAMQKIAEDPAPLPDDEQNQQSN